MEMAMRSSLQTYAKLKSTGFSEAQAQVIVESIEDHAEVSLKDLATKSDIERLERDITWLTRLYMGSTLVILIGLALNFLHH